MKIEDSIQKFTPKVVTFETENEWRAFLAFVGNPDSVTNQFYDREIINSVMNKEEFFNVVDGMISADKYSYYKSELN